MTSLQKKAEAEAKKRWQFDNLESRACRGAFMEGVDFLAGQQKTGGWVRGRDRLPSLFTKVKWRNADWGNIPLGEATPLDHHKRVGPNIEGHEWLDESPPTGEKAEPGEDQEGLWQEINKAIVRSKHFSNTIADLKSKFIIHRRNK